MFVKHNCLWLEITLIFYSKFEAINIRPIFTVHAGEYLVGEFIEKKFKSLNVWIPSKDTGIELLITNKQNNECVSLQVKFSKDFLLKEDFKSGGWWTFNREKLKNSQADYWVLVIYQYRTKESDFIILQSKILLILYDYINISNKMIQIYIWITNKKPRINFKVKI